MHIGIVHYAAPPTVGGVELTIFHHARVLTALGHTVTVVAGQGAPFLPGARYLDEPLAGSRGERVRAAWRELAAGAVPREFPGMVAETRAALLGHLGECDVVIGHNFFTLNKNLALTAAVHELVWAQEGPPWVAWHHDFAWLRPQYQPELHEGYPWELLRCPWPDTRHVTVSAAQRDDLALLYGLPRGEIVVVSPGVDPQALLRAGPKVTHLIERWSLLDAGVLFLLPARITRRKNIELGLRWLAAIRQESGWDARLVITGPPGPHNPANAAYLRELLDLRRELGLQDAAHFVYQAGEEPDQPLLLDDEEMSTLFWLADAMLFPSRQEGFGIPVLEAGLARLPVFATDLPPFRESAAGMATLFAIDTPPAEVARSVVQHLEQDRAYHLRRRVLGAFTWRRIVETRILPLLQEQASSRQRGRNSSKDS
jgi:mannosylglucosylglycerate synthase